LFTLGQHDADVHASEGSHIERGNRAFIRQEIGRHDASRFPGTRQSAHKHQRQLVNVDVRAGSIARNQRQRDSGGLPQPASFTWTSLPGPLADGRPRVIGRDERCPQGRDHSEPCGTTRHENECVKEIQHGF
jgi:hypothetical protein